MSNKKNLLLELVFLLFLIVSCSNSAIDNFNTSSLSESQIPDGYGIVNFSIGQQNTTERSAVSLDTIVPKVQRYEIIIYNSSKRYQQDFLLNDTLSLIVEAGTYNSIIVATEYGSSGKLLGSGFSKDIIVTSGEKTSVNFVLKPFDFSISCPSIVNCSESFDVNFSFDTRNELLRIIGNGIHVKIKSSGVGNNEHSPGIKVTGTYTLTAPAIPAETYVYISSVDLQLYDLSYNKFYSFSSPYTGESVLDFKNITWVPINFIEPESSTGINVSITWEQ